MKLVIMIKSNGISSFIFSSSFKTFCTLVLRTEYDDQQAAAASLAHVADHHGSCFMGSCVRLWNFLDDDSLSWTLYMDVYIYINFRPTSSQLEVRCCNPSQSADQDTYIQPVVEIRKLSQTFWMLLLQAHD
jgi:hypothetical protein